MIMVLAAISSILFFLYSFDYSHSINNENNEIQDEEFDYIFDPGEYIYSEETIEENDNSDSEKNHNNVIKSFNKDEQNNDDNSYNNILTHKSEDNITDYNFVAAGDWYCNEETKRTINNILAVYPELIITTGDQVKESPSAACWIQMSEPIKDKMKIAIGNHDAEFANIYKQIVNYHNLKTPYYSHDFKNIHFISLSTEHPYEEGSKQYKFIKSDLKKSSTNSSIDWIIVHQHKPLYSTNADIEESERIKDTFLPLFEKYGVDFVISGHNQYYERSYPMSNNKVVGIETKDQESMPELTEDNDDDPKSINENT